MCRATFVRITVSRYHTSHVPFALVVARNRAGRVSAREFNASAFIGRDNGVRGRRRPGVHLEVDEGLESYGVTTEDDHTFSMWSKV